jgi:transcriptional regulator with XRE-family HTH domain
MTATVSTDDESVPTDAPPVRLRLTVVDALMAAKGLTSKPEQARAMGIERSYWYDIRAGRSTPSVTTALKIAQATGTSVEALFGRDAA